MASHPYISGPGNVTQMIGYLRKNFPASVTADTVRKFGLASNNESYVINVLQFVGLIDEDGKRTESGHKVMTIREEKEFQAAFGELVIKAYDDLFSLRGEDAWTLSKGELISYFRSADKTSEIIGGRQAAVFGALRELAGHQVEAAQSERGGTTSSKTQKKATKKPTSGASAKTADVQKATPAPVVPQKSDMALTVRIEINLPAEGTAETYDAIFKSIKANLLP